MRKTPMNDSLALLSSTHELKRSRSVDKQRPSGASEQLVEWASVGQHEGQQEYEEVS